MLKKCIYYNDYVTCASLMLDDLSLAAISSDGKLYPWNDWGYGLSSKNSLYSYLENTLLNKFPEIRGTFFFPIKKHGLLNEQSGYKILTRNLDEQLKDFLNHVNNRFDLAFHGTTHGQYTDTQCVTSEKWRQEFEYLKPHHTEELREDIKKVQNLLNIKFTGGKYPGYKKNEHSQNIIEHLGFMWWCSDCHMMNRKHPHNRHRYFGKDYKIVHFPTNVSGNLFNFMLHKRSPLKNKIRPLKRIWKQIKGENYLQYLYENKLIISIQEHHCCYRSDSVRQPINVFDDIHSLDKIFSILRGADIWYATCTDIAHYLESYDYTEIETGKNQTSEIIYKGRWTKPFLSIKSRSRHIKNINTGEIIQGLYKQGMWIYNDIEQGLYKEL